MADKKNYRIYKKIMFWIILPFSLKKHYSQLKYQIADKKEYQFSKFLTIFLKFFEQFYWFLLK